MRAAVNINGRLCGEHDAVVSVFDHGFLFGDGVYEVLRTYGRHPFLFDAHQRRLRESAARIALTVPFTDDEILARTRSTIEALDGEDEAYVRVLLTRGVGELTYDPSACPEPTLVILARALALPAPEIYERGVTLALVDVIRNHPAALNPRIKSNNLLNNALAMQQALQQGGFEALMRNYRGELVECSQSNIFLVRRDDVLTPPLEAGLLAGVTRAFVFELGKECRIPVREAHLYEPDLASASEAFITSTTREIVPVVRVNDRPVGDGHPGEITRRLMDAFHQHAAAAAATPVARR